MDLKVLHVCRTYYPDPPGGVQEAIQQICLATQAFGVNPSVFSLSPRPFPSQIFQNGIKVHREKSWISLFSCDIGDHQALKSFKELSEEHDLINYHFPWPYADLLNLSLSLKIPYVVTYHSDVVRQRLLAKICMPLFLKSLRGAKNIITTSDAYSRSSTLLNRPELAGKVVSIPLGISDKYLGVDLDSKSKIQSYVEEPFFLFLGALRQYKGLDFLLEAAALTDVKVVIAGDGSERRRLEKKAKKASLHNVVFVGSVSQTEKAHLLKQCLALVLPSNLRSEAFGMVLVEASMFGKPMITTELGTGTSFINIHKQTGLVVKPNTSSELVIAMNTLMRDRGKAIKFGKNARLRYEKHFNPESMGKAYSDVYMSSIKER